MNETLTVPDQAIHRLRSALADEAAAQGRVLALLEAQERSIANPAKDEFRDATSALEAELARTPQRSARTAKAMAEVARALGVPASALTVSSVIERVGERAAPLVEVRAELAQAAAAVRAKNVRIAALVRMHRDVTRELLQCVLGTDGQPIDAGGSLIDAEV